MNWLDFIGACCSLTSTYYFTQAKRLAWAVGLCAIALNTLLYFQKGIYGRLVLEGIYSLSMVYGWFQWGTVASSTKPSRVIRALTMKEMFFYGGASSTGIMVLAYILIHYTDSTIPYWDAASTILSLLAQWLLCLKIIHCWILWFIVDMMVAGLQFYKDIPFHSAIHFFYLGMAVIGYRRWQKIMLSSKMEKYVLGYSTPT